LHLQLGVWKRERKREHTQCCPCGQFPHHLSSAAAADGPAAGSLSSAVISDESDRSSSIAMVRIGVAEPWLTIPAKRTTARARLKVAGFILCFMKTGGGAVDQWREKIL